MFHANVRNPKMREKLNTHQVRTIYELFQLANKCARVEEGRRIPREAPMDNDVAETSGGPGKKRNREHKQG